MGVNPIHPASDRPDRKLLPGHDTRALGPSDSSDSGSDTAGPDVRDAELDSDSDRFGTGEREAADRDPVGPEGADIAPDHIERIPDEDEDAGEE